MIFYLTAGVRVTDSGPEGAKPMVCGVKRKCQRERVIASLIGFTCYVLAALASFWHHLITLSICATLWIA